VIGTFTGWARGHALGFIATGGPGIDPRAPDFIVLPSGFLGVCRPGDVVDFWIDCDARSEGRLGVAVDVAVRGAPIDPAERVFIGNVPAVHNSRLRKALEDAIGPVINMIRKPEWDFVFVDFAGTDAKRAVGGTVRVEVDGLELGFRKCREGR
jgi:hypothetical protein